MKLTNLLNLPQPIVDAVNNDTYKREDGVMSITTLLKPPRIVALENEHYDKLTQDASDRIWSLLGQVVHGILERSETVGVVEQRLYAKIGDQKISGQVDRYFNGTLQDYKFTSAWKLKDGCPKEFEEQLNCYAFLLKTSGFIVDKIEIVGILRDWSKMEASRSPDYPQRQIAILDVPIWDMEETKSFLEERIKLHLEAKESLPECSDADRWAKPTKYAVMKKGTKRAVKLHDSKKSAETHALTDDKFYVEKRPGVNTRCRFYCGVSEYCTQYQKLESEK